MCKGETRRLQAFCEALASSCVSSQTVRIALAAQQAFHVVLQGPIICRVRKGRDAAVWRCRVPANENPAGSCNG